MGRRKKGKFIDKKTAHHFHVVHRSSRDPLAADENASKYVLQPITNKGKQEMSESLENQLDGYLQLNFPELDVDAILGETQREDADQHEAPSLTSSSLPHEYDYTTHLRSINNQRFRQYEEASSNAVIAGSIREQNPLPENEREREENRIENLMEEAEEEEKIPQSGLNLPEDVFPSEYEEETGILERDINVRGEIVDVTQDFYTALENGPNGEEVEELDDMFVQTAMQEMQEVQEEEEEKYQHFERDREEDEMNEFGDDVEFMKEYIQQAFDGSDGSDGGAVSTSNHSTTATTTFPADILPVSATAQASLDEQFSRVLRQYDDFDDCYDEDADGPVEDVLSGEYGRIMDQFIAHNDKSRDDMDLEIELNHATHKAIERFALNDDEADETPEETASKIESMFRKPERDRWDCESIVSTYSNIENHPNVISRRLKRQIPQIKLSSKTGLPVDAVAVKPQTPKTSNEEETSQINLGARRKKNESKVDKKLRKQALKDQRKHNRERKKQLKNSFKAEHDEQVKKSMAARTHHQTAVRLR